MRSASLRLAVIGAAAAFAVACKSQWPAFDENKISLVLAAGTFSGYFITHGILLEDIRTFLASVAPTTESYYCRACEFPEEAQRE